MTSTRKARAGHHQVAADGGGRYRGVLSPQWAHVSSGGVAVPNMWRGNGFDFPHLACDQ
jgi:hypothetical protein